MKRVCTLAAGLAASLVTVQAWAGLICAEGFESYAAGSQLENGAGVGGNGGTGWTGAWDVTDAYRANVTIQAQSLSYVGGAIQVSGGDKALRLTGFDATGANFVLATRGLPNQTGTTYLSFLFRTTSAAGVNSDFTQFGLDPTAGNPRASIGHNVNTAFDPDDHDFFARVTTTSGNSTFTGTPSQVNRTYFLVAKFAKTGASTNYNRVDLYVDPTTLTEPAAASATRTGDAGISSLAYFITRVAFLETTDTYFLDEFKVGDTYLSVTPEPATLALAGLGAAVLAARRRRAGRPAGPPARPERGRRAGT